MAENDPLDSWELPEDPWEFLEESDAEVVAKFYSPLEADLAAARLRSENIPCFLSNVASQHVQTQVMNMVRLHVHKDYLDRAKELVAETIPEPEDSGSSVGVGILIVLAIFIGLMGLTYLVRYLLDL